LCSAGSRERFRCEPPLPFVAFCGKGDTLAVAVGYDPRVDESPEAFIFRPECTAREFGDS